MSKSMSFNVRLPKVMARLIAKESDLKWVAEMMQAKVKDGRVEWETYHSGYGDTVDVRLHTAYEARPGYWMVWLENADPRRAEFVKYQGRPLQAKDLESTQVLRNIKPMIATD